MAKTASAVPAEVLRDVRGRIKTEGVEAAFRAHMEVCQDPQAPANAKSASATALFRAAGLFEKQEDDDEEVELHLMSRAQLSRAAAQARANLEQIDAEGALETLLDQPNVFD